jgi:hypothetical protein
MGGNAKMACRCIEKDMCLRDLDRLARANGYTGEAAGEDASMNDNLNSGKGNVPSAYTSDTEGELYGAIDDVHNQVSEKISGLSSEINEATTRVKIKYDEFYIEDEIYHAEEGRMGA